MENNWVTLRVYVTVHVLLAVPSAALAQASEVIANRGPAPETVENLHGPIAIAFKDDEQRSGALLKSQSEWLDSTPPFWADITLDANIRTYYFLRDNAMTSIVEKNEAWAAGGYLNLESGKLWHTISIGGEYFASAPIDAPDNTPGSGLLKPIQSTISTFGQAYVRGTFKEQVVTFGRQRIDKPYLNGNDSRMLANTFLGITLDGRWNRGRFFVGYIDKIKDRNSEKFVSMGRRAGVLTSDEGLWEIGARYEWGDGNFVGAVTSYIPDVISTSYSEIDLNWISGKWGFRFGAQFTDQRSVGNDLLSGSSIDTQAFGARFSAGINNLILTTAVSYNGDSAEIRTPFGGDPSFTSLMVSDFNLANQTTYRVGVSYTGTSFGYPGISGFINYARGINAVDGTTGVALSDSSEIDVTVDFRAAAGFFDDIWLRVRYGVLDLGNSRKRYNVRATVNWGLPLL